MKLRIEDNKLFIYGEEVANDFKANINTATMAARLSMITNDGIIDAAIHMREKKIGIKSSSISFSITNMHTDKVSILRMDISYIPKPRMSLTLDGGEINENSNYREILKYIGGK